MPILKTNNKVSKVKCTFVNDGGLKFDGVNDYVQLPFASSIGLNTPFSFVLYLKLISFPNSSVNCILDNRKNGMQGINITTRLYSGVKKFDIAFLNSILNRYGGVTINQSINLNENYHIVFTKGSGYANSNFKCYLNGISGLEDYSFFTAPLNSGDNIISDQNWVLSIYKYFFEVPSNIYLFDAKFFNKELTPIEVAYLNNNKQLIPSSCATNCVLDMRFNDKSGTVAKDRSGNNYNGTLTNFANTSLGASNAWVDQYGNSITQY